MTVRVVEVVVTRMGSRGLEHRRHPGTGLDWSETGAETETDPDLSKTEEEMGIDPGLSETGGEMGID